MEKAEMKEALKEALAESKHVRVYNLPEEIHEAHHTYVARLVERDRQRRETWDKVRVHIFGWSAVSAIGGLIYSLGEWIRHLIGKH